MNNSVNQWIHYDTPNHRLALRTAKKLTDAGFTAYFAGGCVRDSLLGRPPKDYDVATDATPDQVRELFGKRRTLAIGAAFGVICVLGDDTTVDGQIEVATFRNDGAYIDGRRPISIQFSSPREDAQRRDFTINGLFFDPLRDEVIDFVGGREDLRLGIVRAIGTASDRFTEDKLRLLRGVRFAAEFDFEIEPETFQAIRQLADQITTVSGERISAEIQRCLMGSQPRRAIRLLDQSQLLYVLIPEIKGFWEQSIIPTSKMDIFSHSEREVGQQGPTYSVAIPELVDSTKLGGFAASLAATMLPAIGLDFDHATDKRSRRIKRTIDGIASRWRLSNEIRDAANFALTHFQTVIEAASRPWSEVQPVLIHSDYHAVMALARAIVHYFPAYQVLGVQFCEARLSWPMDQLNPPPLLNGDELRQAGYAPGPKFRNVLQLVRDEQLNGSIQTREQALTIARTEFNAGSQ